VEIYSKDTVLGQSFLYHSSPLIFEKCHQIQRTVVKIPHCIEILILDVRDWRRLSLISLVSLVIDSKLNLSKNHFMLEFLPLVRKGKKRTKLQAFNVDVLTIEHSFKMIFFIIAFKRCTQKYKLR
jgi:hypothetical protein